MSVDGSHEMEIVTKDVEQSSSARLAHARIPESDRVSGKTGTRTIFIAAIWV